MNDPEARTVLRPEAAPKSTNVSIRTSPPNPMCPDSYVSLRMRGLPFSAEEAEIVEFFDGFAIVAGSCKIGLQEDGRKAGTASLMLESEEEVKRAMAEREGEKIGHRWVNLTPQRAADHDNFGEE